jgi:hypothetical protein
VGDRIYLDPGQTDQDLLLIDTIPSGTVLNCRSEGEAKTHTHVTNTIIALSIACSEILLTALTNNAGLTWLGSDSTVTVGGGSGFTYITASGSYNLGFPQWNAIRSTEAWMIGTSGDKIGVAAIVA